MGSAGYSSVVALVTVPGRSLSTDLITELRSGRAGSCAWDAGESLNESRTCPLTWAAAAVNVRRVGPVGFTRANGLYARGDAIGDRALVMRRASRRAMRRADELGVAMI